MILTSNVFTRYVFKTYGLHLVLGYLLLPFLILPFPYVPDNTPITVLLFISTVKRLLSIDQRLITRTFCIYRAKLYWFVCCSICAIKYIKANIKVQSHRNEGKRERKEKTHVAKIHGGQSVHLILQSNACEMRNVHWMNQWRCLAVCNLCAFWQKTAGRFCCTLTWHCCLALFCSDQNARIRYKCVWICFLMICIMSLKLRQYPQNCSIVVYFCGLQRLVHECELFPSNRKTCVKAHNISAWKKTRCNSVNSCNRNERRKETKTKE